MLRNLCVQFLFIACIWAVVSAGVFPNYHGNFEFVEWDKEQTVDRLDASKKWWETAAFYQIYPRSFKDSDGDGVGDLKGITEQLPYLKEIGITATWLSPIFTSPMADFGYDIANFTEIDPIFGTMEDFDALIEKAKKIGMRIILDFVPNHSSDECEWFQRSAARDPVYEDFYVWHPGKMIDGVRHPPTNWISVFRGSAWQWHEGRQEYYLHQFVSKQPDFNYRNPKVKEMMNDVLRFWLRKGVSGFRVDAVPHVFEVAPDAEGNWPDEPRNTAVKDPDDYEYLKHPYTVDQPETIELVYEWRRVLDEFQQEEGGEDRILMAETYSPLNIVMQYYGNETVNGAQIPFNFLLIGSLTNQSTAFDYANTIQKWLIAMPEGRTANWVLGNHDRPRVGTRLGRDRIDMMNMLILTLPGCSVTYQGEEIGMTDVWISWEDTVDPAACNSNPDIYEKFSRDPVRTPFQWNDAKDAGFSVAEKTWLPLANNYKEVNVMVERKPSLSHLNIYKDLQNLRSANTLRYGTTEVTAVIRNVLAVKRSLLNDYTYITLLNINDRIETFNLNTVFKNLPEILEYVILTDRSMMRKGDRVKSSLIRLMPKESVVLRSTTKLSTTVGYYAYYLTEDSRQ